MKRCAASVDLIIISRWCSGKHIFSLAILAENFGLPFNMLCLFQKSFGWSSPNCPILTFRLKFPEILVNGKQPLTSTKTGVVPHLTGKISNYSVGRFLYGSKPLKTVSPNHTGSAVCQCFRQRIDFVKILANNTSLA